MTDYIQFMGYRFEITTCGTSGIPFIDTCVDVMIISSFNQLLMGMYSVIIFIWLTRQAKFMG